MPFLLTKLRINEVSGVDRGAGEGVRIMLMKRLENESPYVSIEKIDLADAVVAYLKREFSDDKRKELAASGKAMSGGGYPIENGGDLENAIRAIGRAKDPKATKQHIISRARALGMSDKIPDDWTQTQPTKKRSIDVLAAIVKAAKNADIALPIVKRAQDAVLKIIDSPAYGDDGEIGVLKDCASYLAKNIPAGKIADEFTAACDAAIQKDDDIMPMTDAQIAEAITKAVTTATAPFVKKIDEQSIEIAVLKMSPKAQKYFKAMPDKTEEDKKKKKEFVEKAAAAQDEEAEDAADGGDDEEAEDEGAAAKKKKKMEKALAGLPPEIVGILKSIEPAIAENVALKKRLDVMSEKDQIEEFAKRATALGLAKADGEILRKAYGGDADAIKKLEERIVALSRQANPVLFAELGKSAGDGGNTDAYATLSAKADEVRKADPKLSREQAFAKVYTDPANSELVAQQKREEVQKRRAA